MLQMGVQVTFAWPGPLRVPSGVLITGPGWFATTAIDCVTTRKQKAAKLNNPRMWCRAQRAHNRKTTARAAPQCLHCACCAHTMLCQAGRLFHWWHMFFTSVFLRSC